MVCDCTLHPVSWVHTRLSRFPCLSSSFRQTCSSLDAQDTQSGLKQALYIQEPLCLLTHASSYIFNSVQSLSHVWLFVTPWISAHQAPCQSPTHRVYSNSCPSSRWCHPTISSSVIPFSSCPQSLPASESFPMSQHFAWGGQSIGVSASASVLPMNTQDWSPLG